MQIRAEDTVTKIKDKLNILDVVSSYIEVKKAGLNFTAKCPFHNEKSPSFFISPQRGGYYCFGCGAKGDIFSFVQAFEGLDFKGALKILAERAGVPLVYQKNYNRNDEMKKKEEKELLYEVMEESMRFFEQNLKNKKEPEEYLLKRGLKPITIKYFRLGYALNEWRSLLGHLKKLGYSEKIIEMAGLIKKGEKTTDGSPYYDRFRGRIMFPITDSSGRVIAFTGRIFEGDEKESAKYLNSPETLLFKKSEVLYGIDKAKQYIREKGYTILVEGQMDMILVFQAGYRNIVAGSGTALTVTNLSRDNSNKSREDAVSNFEMIKRISPNIILVYDSDDAGYKAAERSAGLCLSIGMDVKSAFLPKGLDPADAITKDPEIWKKALKEAKYAILYILEMIIGEAQGDSRKISKGVSSRVIPLVALIATQSEKSYFIKSVTDKTGIKEEALWEDLKSYQKKHLEKNNQVRSGNLDAHKNNENSILKMDTANRLQKIASKIYILHEFLLVRNSSEDLIKKIEGNIKRITDQDWKIYFANDDMVHEKDFFEREKIQQTEANIEKEIEDLIKNFEEEYLMEEINKKNILLKQKEKDKDYTETEKISKEIHEILKKIALLRK